MIQRFILFFYIIIGSIRLLAIERADVIVAQDGSGDFTSIQAAIDAAPNNASAHFIILIKKWYLYFDRYYSASGNTNFLCYRI